MWLSGRKWAWLLLVVLAFVSGRLQAAVVLQYHHVSESTPKSTSVSPTLFEEHMAYLEEESFNIMALPELIDRLEQGKALPDKTAIITFDDAYESVYESAFPTLKERDWPFTLFVNTDPIDKGRKGFVTWDQLREMAEHGATIANHSTQHNHLQRRKAGENHDQWQERIIAEVGDAQDRIEEEVGQRHKVLAYPYGEYNSRVQGILDALGYVAFAQNSGPIGEHSDPLALPRFPFGGVYGTMNDFTLKVNTLPMPIKDTNICSDPACETALDDLVVPEGTRPVLSMAIDERLLKAVNCFASHQGRIETRVEDGRVVTQASEPLKPGRSQYNCTAPSGEPGRFHWYSQQWLVTDEAGNWVHEN